MKRKLNIINKFRDSIFVEYLPMFFIVITIFVIFLIMDSKTNKQEETSSTLSCINSSMSILDKKEEYNNYQNSFEIYTDESIGFSFQYPSHMKIFSIISHTILSYREDDNNHGKIIVSIGLNDENMTAEEWLFSYNSGYLQSKDQYGDCYRALIDGQEAVYTDGGMWVVVNTPDNKYRLSIADLTIGNDNPPFMEIDMVIESLKFSSFVENKDNFLPVIKHETIELEGRVYNNMTYGRRVFKNLDENSDYKYFIVEPHDYTEDGADKYSPTTRSLRGDERVKTVGTIVDYCWWDEEKYNGCVPWIEAERMDRIDDENIE